MSPKTPVPQIDARKASDLLRQLRGMAPHYTKEWPATDDADPGVALLKIFSFIAEGVISRLNRAPERNFLAFLDMLGIRLLPATPARAPVRFLVATGTEDSFLVPSGTQVSAAATEARPTELPFETMKSLQVIPAALTAVLAVDPERDQIYRSPPGFLELEVAATRLPTLNVTAFSAAGTKFLQLDPPGQVKAGDFLRVEQGPGQGSRVRACTPTVNPDEARTIDHLVASDVKGTMVAVRDPLPRDYAEDTRVEKVTRFELFEGKNWQEHVLYLAHSEYFAIKSEAEITLLVEHASGASSNLEAFDVIWEFFGVTETDEEEGWHAFQVDSDETQGFSRNGRVALIKPAGEIKEKEINGDKSRWIRARLEGPLPATPPRPLPKIESITFAVSSGGKALAADQAFNNDTPLTINLKFFPFGTEPRIFDRFSIASEEAFSKPGAEVTLNLQLDFTDLLASPVAIFKDQRIRAFAHGAAGRLVEFQIDPLSSGNEVISHATPTDRRLVGALSPAVAHVPAQTIIGVFARADDNHVHLRYIPSADKSTWAWIDLKDSKLAGELRFDPAAVFSNLQWRVYVVADSSVFFRDVNPLSPQPGDWAEVTSSPNTLLKPVAASTPFPAVVQSISVTNTWLAVTDEDGHTWTFDGTTWRDLPRPSPSFLAAKNARPYIVSNPVTPPATDVLVFVRSDQGELVSFTIKLSDSSVTTQNLGAPGGGVLVASNPFVNPAGTRVVVRGSDNQLWVVDPSTLQWTSHPNPLDAALAGDPFVLGYAPVAGSPVEVTSVLSTSNKNLLLEFRMPGADVEHGNIIAGPKDLLLLENVPTAGPTYFVQITKGAASNSSEDATRKIDSIQGNLARLEKPLDDIPKTGTKYDLYEQVEADPVTATSVVLDEVDLKVGTGAAAKDFIFIGLELREIISKAGDTVTLVSPLSSLPQIGDPYVILKQLDTNEQAEEGSVRRVVLPPPTLPANDYKGLFLEISFGVGQSPVIRRIEEYDVADQVIVLEQDLPGAPPPNSSFKITVGSLPEGWQSYRDPDQTELRPELSWEYWNGKGWVFLPVKDSTEKFLVPGTVAFVIPDDMAKTEVAGQENYWIRARIVGGDYGRELFAVDPVTNKITVEKDPIRPPLVKQFDISYKLTEMLPPQFCLTFNNLNYLNQTAANVTPDKHFNPYIPLSDTGKAVYFGFDKAFDGGPVRLYFAARELEVNERDKPKLAWEFAFDNGWSDVLAEDDTDALTKPEFVSLIVPEGFQNRQEFGQALYWMRATLTDGSWTKSPLLEGVFVNTVETLQARTVSDEILGSSTGVKKQVFRFQQLPVMEGEEVRVREVLTDQEREQLIAERGQEAVLSLRDQQGRVLETWVRWTEVMEFFASESVSRHYRLDRAAGELEFGDGVRGRIPPAGGDNIKAFAYQAGGGAGGNVKPGEITSAVTAVAGVDSVINPVAGGGGSEAATNDDMLVVGPEQISNRGRAVTPDDFEQLAREASREVRKARCLPNRNASGRHESGWTSVHIVPDSKDAEPMPSLELRRAVQRYLAQRADVTLADQEHIFVGPPEYVPVSVYVTVFARSLDVVASAEQSVSKQLDRFLHPLTGGPTGGGWDFGRDLAASDLYSLLEDIKDVDHVGQLRLLFGGKESDERVEVGANALIASGTHKITMTVGAGE